MIRQITGEGRFITPDDTKKTRDKVLGSLVNRMKKQFKGQLVDKRCSINYEIDERNPRLGYITMGHYDLMDKNQEKGDAISMMQIASNHPEVEDVELLGNIGHQPSFREFANGIMPSLTIKVKTQI